MSEEAEYEKKRKWSWQIFMACMFIGLGAGMLLGSSGAGVIIGMGVGFLLGSLIEVERRISITFPRSIGGVAMIIIGLGFILLGFEMLGYLPRQIIQYAGALAFIGLGILMLAAGGRILKR